MSEVLERRSETLGAAIRLDDGRGLALDRESPGEYVGWTLFETADFNSIEGVVRDRVVSVSEAIKSAPDSRHIIVTATLYAIAHNDDRTRTQIGIRKEDREVALGQSERLIEELVEAGVSREVVLSLAHGIMFDDPAA